MYFLSLLGFRPNRDLLYNAQSERISVSSNLLEAMDFSGIKSVIKILCVNPEYMLSQIIPNFSYTSSVVAAEMSNKHTHLYI